MNITLIEKLLTTFPMKCLANLPFIGEFKDFPQIKVNHNIKLCVNPTAVKSWKVAERDVGAETAAPQQLIDQLFSKVAQ